ncbi:MAG TPA: hypothetical protein VG147_11610 [Solirubrobacteraceae bacterium]|jgi:hypothetical protein|nr:hypothetical protein [Solirubrobacteraceae bacterium]
MSHNSTPRRRLTALPSLIALTAALGAASLGLAACGGSSSTSTTTTTETTANAAATGTTTGTTTAGKTSTGTSSTGTTPSRSAGALQIAAIRSCLAKKGITLPHSHPLAGAHLPKGMSRTQFYAELRGCAGGIIPPGDHGHGRFHNGVNGYHNPFKESRFHPVLMRLAACLRQHGIKVGEPNTSDKGPIFEGVNTGSTQFKAAMTNCRYTLLGALKSKRAYPGAGKAG